MQAKDQHLLEFLEQVHQLTIPIYQRKYSWTKKQCNQLFEDILRIGESNERSHFIGAIVFKQYYDRISKKIIIDGQQRITTINLLISALVDFLLNNNIENLDTDAEEMMNSYLINSAKKGETNYKLILTMDDKTTLIKIIDNLRNENKVDFDDADSEILQDNYSFFKRKITEDNIGCIIKGLRKLLIVYMELTDFDNPQLIFESMNSTGLDLNKTDLIRNYLLMDLNDEEQKDLYNNYWHNIELTFEKNNYSFDNFIKDYLTLKYDKVMPKDFYEEFKKYSKTLSIDELVKDIYKYTQYFTKIVFNKEENKKLNNAFQSLNKLDTTTTLPFLLRLYDDYDNSILDVDDFIRIVKYTESYVFRRFICDLPTPSLRKTYAEMYKSIDKDNYLESYKFILLNKSDNKRMPNDEEFERSLISRDIYNLKKNNKYLLGKLENYNSKEPINVFSNQIQIEHIMPQTLTPVWKKELGEDWNNIHKIYLHTLGNLTLTGYNPELSNKSFQEKRDMKDGFKESQIKLNRYLSELSHWNETEIIKRRNYLIEKSKEIWIYPTVSNEVLERYDSYKNNNKQVYTIEDLRFLQENSPMKSLYDELSKKILDIDRKISVEPKKKYVRFNLYSSPVVAISPQKELLILTLFMPFNVLYDSLNLCNNIEDNDWWSSAGVELRINNFNEVEYALEIIKQSYNYVNEGFNEME